MTTQPGWPHGVTVVAVEGIDGAGKSTLVAGLRVDLRLRQAFTAVSGMAEFSSPIGPTLRDSLSQMSPVSIAYAFAAERHWLIERCDRTPGGLVIWDRYVDSAYACRSADVRAGRAPAPLLNIVREIAAKMPRPDVTLYVAASVATASARLRRRQQLLGLPVRNDERLLHFQREAYEELWDAQTSPPRWLDGETNPDALLEQAVEAILSSR